MKELFDFHYYDGVVKHFAEKGIVNNRDIPLATLREMLINQDWQGAVKAIFEKGTINNMDIPKTTLKELINCGNYEGVIRGLARGVHAPLQDGVRRTIKELLTHTEYKGNLRGLKRKHASRADGYNTRIDDRKEIGNTGRAPTAQGVKQIPQKGQANVSLKENINIERDMYPHIDSSRHPDQPSYVASRVKHCDVDNTRFDTSVLSSLDCNPYNIDILDQCRGKYPVKYEY